MKNFISPSPKTRKGYYIIAACVGLSVGLGIAAHREHMPSLAELRSVNAPDIFLVVGKLALEFCISCFLVGTVGTLLHEFSHVLTSLALGLPIRQVQIGIYKPQPIGRVLGMEILAGPMTLCGAVRPARLRSSIRNLPTRIRLVALSGPLVTVLALIIAWSLVGGVTGISSIFEQLESMHPFLQQVRDILKLSVLLVLASQASSILPIPPKWAGGMLCDGWIALTGQHPDYVND